MNKPTQCFHGPDWCKGEVSHWDGCDILGRPQTHRLCVKHGKEFQASSAATSERIRHGKEIAESIAAHPASGSVGGRASLDAWLLHPDGCVCPHCLYVNAHADDVVDA